MLNWTAVGAIATILAVIVAALTLLYAIKQGWGKDKEYPTTVSKILIIPKKIINMVLGPRLTIEVKEVTCRINMVNFSDQSTFGSRKRIQWYIETLIEIKNTSRRNATQINGTMKLQIGHGKYVSKRENTVQIHSLTAKSGVHREKVIFKSVFFDEEKIEYPDSSYCLEYLYSCQERIEMQKVKVGGTLTRADWIGDDSVLQAIKTHVPESA